MRNIVLISQDRKDITEERRQKIVRTILDSGKFKIILMVVNAGVNKDTYLCHKGVENVITSLELECFESMKGLTYEDILMNKDKQLKIESGAYRLYGDYQIDKYYYYCAMAFWTRFFSENKVDIILHTKAYHGFAYDCCDLVARKYGIKSYHVMNVGYNDTYAVYHQHELLPIEGNNDICVEYLLQSKFDKASLPPSIEKKDFTRRILYRIGGNLLEDFVYRLVNWDWSSRSILRKRAKITWFDKFAGYVKLMLTKRSMESLSCIPNYKENYVCYFLHVEPEAPTYVSPILESQLVIIKMLSETLPKGWYVYVKEHPVQFKVNNDFGYYRMFDAPLFKTKKFYEKINSMSNVRIINLETKSSDLIKNSKAVASIMGTVFFESVLVKKPIIVFSDLNPATHISESFSVHSYDDCEKALREIERGYVPNYNDADAVIRKYVFSGSEMPAKVLKLIDEAQ